MNTKMNIFRDIDQSFLDSIPPYMNFVVVYRGFTKPYDTQPFGDTYRYSGDGRDLQVCTQDGWSIPSDHWQPIDGFDVVEFIVLPGAFCV